MGGMEYLNFYNSFKIPQYPNKSDHSEIFLTCFKKT